MEKGYWIASYRSVADPTRLDLYAKLGLPAIEAGGGRFLARGIAAGRTRAARINGRS